MILILIWLIYLIFKILMLIKKEVFRTFSSSGVLYSSFVIDLDFYANSSSRYFNLKYFLDFVTLNHLSARFDESRLSFNHDLPEDFLNLYTYTNVPPLDRWYLNNLHFSSSLNKSNLWLFTEFTYLIDKIDQLKLQG